MRDGNSMIDNKYEEQMKGATVSKILIVEDSPINRQILKKILDDSYEILEAGNGQEALDVLAENWEDVAVILLDLMMPVMDGYTFLAKAKEQKNYASIPVIVTTSSDSEKDEVKALSSGATDFIRKPYHWQIVKHRVKSIITLRETAAMFNLIKYDQLTGLSSKEYFYKMMDETLREHPDREYDLISCDIENFSIINDTFGYDTGNDLLKLVAGVLTECFSDYLYCARLNSDIFILLVPHQERYPDGYFQLPVDKTNERFKPSRIQIDFGVYHVVDDGSTVHVSCNRALSVIEKIKGNFAKNVTYYDEDFKKSKDFAHKITATMEKALHEGEFLVYYQPKYSLATEEIAGAEALVRWISPEEGFMNPGMFIPLFEKNGFITELDKYVWESVCKFQRKAKDEGVQTYPISVNVSRTDLYNLDVPAFMTELIKKYDLEPEDLHLEVTESAYSEHPEMIIEITNRLTDLGFVLEMDDFGTGYSSLNMLSDMTFDILKLDMRFAQNHMENKRQNEVLAFILELAKRMDLGVIAEGVETKEQAENLRFMGSDLAQGFYFAKPMPEKDFWELLKNL
ncbi:EAL domain-containing protein (putative c-di-GMP-specific phosphodiesterase class I)/CheY-like chemotaxis protein [Lachnospiraceae bacterium PFB1-21]|uniref:two-component system response regulator n=1 Tax=Ohessyouella blattaphilus TaxID=2949333 RepID=UPI002569BD86|nr:EAL domain-containing protein [Lachnospiraceae bacterium OttesenSCG-928-J05]